MITGAQVIINSVDQSANLTGEVQIDVEEGVARTANFTLLLSSGITDVVGWTGKTVVIKSDIDSTLKTEFTGVIDTPEYDIETGIATLTCTDNLQEYFETKTKTEIDTATPGAFWSEAVFNDSEGWEYAQERMSSIPSALDKDELGATRITAWAAKTTPDYTLTESGFIYGSLKNPTLANRRSIINAVDITLDYRYTRLKERQLVYDLDDNLSEDDWVCLEPSYPPLKKVSVEEGIASTGWQLITSIVYKELPVGTFSPCGTSTFAAPQYCRGATFTIGKRYAQNVTEKYTIRVESADSIAELGEIAVIQSGSAETEYDLTSWDASLITDGWTEYGTPSIDVNSDNYVNKDDDTERQAALDTIINIAKTKILASHRNTQVSFEIPYNQNLDSIHTVYINSTKLQAKGKVTRIVKTIDTFSGKAVCNVTINLSKKFGTGIPGTEDAPATPDGLPTVIDTQTKDLLPEFHLGGRSATVYDPNWAGYIADYTIITEPGHVSYPTEFVINTPAITLNSIDNIEPSDTSLLNVTIPDDTLS